MNITRKHKLLSLVALCLAAIICLSSCATTAAGTTASSAKDANGELGENITWSYTAKTKTLSINGKGDMPAIASAKDVPWAAARQSAETISVENGILSIADYAFYGFDAATKVDIPESVSSIGKLSFAFCTSLTSVKLPSTLSSIGDSAFEWCASLKTVNVGKSLTSLGTRAFAYCSSLESAFLCSKDLEIKAETFNNASALTVLVLHPTITESKVDKGAFVGTEMSYSLASFDEEATETVTIAVNYYLEGETQTVYETAKIFAVGETYEIVTPTREGYTADKEVVSGIAQKDDVVTVIYKEIIVETEPESETEPVREPEEEKSPLANAVAIIVLVVVLAAIGVGAYFLMRSNKAEEAKQKTQNKAKNRKEK